MMRIQITVIILLLISCQMKKYDYSSIVNKDSQSIIKSYQLNWEKNSHRSEIGDSLRVFLHSAELDTFKYPNWYSPPTRLKFELLNRTSVSFKFYFVEDTLSTNTVYDTLGAGDYFLTLDYTGLKSGLYLFHRQLGDSSITRKFVLLFRDN